MKNIIIYWYRYVNNLLATPVRKYYLFFLTFLLLMCLPDIYHVGLSRVAFNIISKNFLCSYIFVLIIYCMPNKVLELILESLFMFFLFSFFVMDLFCTSKYETRFNQDIAGVIIGTNANEAMEFVSFFADRAFFLLLLFFIFIIILMIVIFKTLISKRRIREWACKLFFFVFIICVLNSIRLSLGNTQTYPDSLYGKINLLINTKSPPNLSEFQSPSHIIVSKDKPKCIVVILGESFSKSHSSLYGYSKETNPCLSKLVDSGMLEVFTNVTSAALQTVQSFQCMMSTYKPEYEDSIDWYKCETIPNVMKTAGYHTYWLSNQSKSGLGENIIGEYAKLCDEVSFCGDMFMGGGRAKNSLDKELLPLIDKALCETEEYKCVFIHLMGSHMTFRRRYPDSFSVFDGGSDYGSLPEHQRQRIAEYDNSVLYNDFVVSEIFKRLNSFDAVAIYCSDHGLDLYESDDFYCGHAKNTKESSKFGYAIPFFVYTSPIFKKQHPFTMELIHNSINHIFRTDDLIYTIMDIANIRFKKTHDVESFSIFQQKE